MPRSVFPALFGNDSIRTIVGGDILAGRLGHAYILEGPSKSGKHTAALSIAAAASCENRMNSAYALPCGKCLACRKMAGGISPDILFVRREDGRATLGVETIRRLREDLWIAPNENEKKVYIIEDADTMTPQAQNALLLSLEDPPPYVVFLLLTENASALLETVRSRAPILRMQCFEAEKLLDFLKKESSYEAIARNDPDFFAAAVAASGGSLGKARLLLSRTDAESAEILSLREEAMRILPLLFHSDASAAANILLSLPKERENVARVLEFVLLALRDLSAVKKGADVPLTVYTAPEECRAVSDKVSLGRLVMAYDSVRTAREDILANASVQTVCAGLLFKKH